MTGMERTIEQVARVLAEHSWSAAIGGCSGENCQWHGGDSEDEQDRHAVHVARALAEAGLLAPAPLREEWACRYTLRSGKVKTRREATERAAREWIGIGEGQPAILRRYVTDWEEA